MLTLAIAERSYSSWSLRGWLLCSLTGAPLTVRHAPLRTPEFAALMEAFAPARTVPALEIADPAGPVRLWDTMAIAETLAERFPEAGLWPGDPAARAAARSVAAEMHGGFAALRRACPMALERAYAGFEAPEEALADAARVEELWAWARGRWGRGGPWLFGARYGAADAFYAPVAARFATYGLARSDVARDYVAAHDADPAFRRWRAMGVAEGARVARYEFDLPEAPRAGPAPRPARAVAEAEGRTAVNAACPYSGRPVRADSLAEIDGRVIGFCNPFCRDKSVADAEAWPALSPLLP